MSNSAIQAQWSLNDTGVVAWNTLKGIVTAATSDNVQALALMACDRFGNTLAMSDATTNKVERILLPSPEPAPIRFLQGAVGFSRNDCATQLGKSAAGLRFLGLAAALVTSLGAFEGARSLDLMLKSTTDDLTTVPSVRHLRDLLASLEARSHRCGFADSVVGWQILLRKALLPCIFSEETRQRLGRDPLHSLEKVLLESTPSPEAIAGLVDVFRQVARMGPATVLGATIRVGAAAPWVLAFAQWCVEPPSLLVGGKEVLEQPRSRLRVVISGAVDDIGKPFEVTIHHQLEDLTRLLGPPSQNSTTGMVNVESYRTWSLQELGFGEGKLRLLQEALEHAIPLVLRKMMCPSFARLGQDANSRPWLGSTDNSADSCRLSPLPNIHTIADTCATFLALKDSIRFVSSNNCILVAELPLVKLHLGALAEQCPCGRQCRNLSTRHTRPAPGRWCAKEEFFRSLSFIIMDIFALTLFNSASPPLVRLSLGRENGYAMREQISNVIRTGDPEVFDDMDLLEWARSMAGHTFDNEDRSLIITSSKGQVIYPIVLDTFHIERQGYLMLYCLPGVLRYNDDLYDVVSHPDAETLNVQHDAYDDSPDFPQKVCGPLNLFRGFRVSWKISVRDNKEIHAALTLRSETNNSPAIELDPLTLLLSLSDTLLVESCPHDQRDPLVSEDQFTSYSSPWDKHDEASDTTSKVDVVAVDGADDLRCLALACSDTFAVLRRNSCLACCLSVCRLNDVHVLIL